MRPTCRTELNSKGLIEALDIDIEATAFAVAPARGPNSRYGLRLLFLLPFAFLLVLLLVDLTPLVLALPLSLVNTAVFDDTVLLFVFAGMFALTSTTPSRGGFPAALLLLAFGVPLVTSAELPHPVRATAPVSTSASAKLRCIVMCPPLSCRVSPSQRRTLHQTSDRATRLYLCANRSQSNPHLPECADLHP